MAAVFKSCTISYSFGATFRAWKSALELMGQEKINLKPLITHTIPLEEFRKGFELLENKEALKVIMKASDY